VSQHGEGGEDKDNESVLKRKEKGEKLHLSTNSTLTPKAALKLTLTIHLHPHLPYIIARMQSQQPRGQEAVLLEGGEGEE